MIGKTAKIKSIDEKSVVLNYGRGRPQTNRPSAVNLDDVSLAGVDDA